ncbi:MAG: hypothetical protein ACLP1X_04030 [Polyangiaceae bacterium]|jgi:hypothetical protein
MGTPVLLDRVTPLALDPGAHVVMHGIARTSVDGTVFDALAQWDGLSTGASRAGGLFDPVAGGLRMTEAHPDRHEYVFESEGTPAPACAAAGVPSPCLVPRLAEIGHERLRTAAELASTLSGAVEVEPALAPALAPATLRAVATVAGVLGAAAVIMALVAISRRLARSPMGRVRAAAREAMRATRNDATLQRLRGQVHVLVARAAHLNVARRECARRLRRIDRFGLAKRTEACARSAAPEAGDAMTWLTAEHAEAARLEADLAASIVGLERIESALRVVAMRARSHRGTRARARRGDPVDAVAVELDLRDEGLAEADRFLGP